MTCGRARGRLLLRVLALAPLLLGAAILAEPSARAAQDGVVTADAAEVHQFANSTSPVIGQLVKDAKVRMSSSLVHDVHGEYWYKVRMSTGENGYVRASQVKPMQLESELHRAGLDSGRKEAEDVDMGGFPAIFELRAMFVAGYELNSRTFEPTGEGELTVSLFPFSHGYLRRMLAAGVAYQALSQDPAILASLAFHIYSESRAEPVIRLRFGQETSSGSLAAGLNAGIEYPITMDMRGFSFYAEVGGLVGFNSGSGKHVFGSLGLSLHF